VIREALAADAEAIAALLGQLGYPAPAEDVPRRLTNLRGGGGEAFVALDAGGVAGVITVLAEASLTNSADIGLITALVVDDEARGKGIGRRLLEAAEAWAAARGCRKLVVTTANHRAGAHQFYERLGWKWTGRRYVKSEKLKIEN
jgi:GNAT superfamily N-acetyltransferase